MLRRTLLVLLATALAVGPLWVTASPARACSCAHSDTARFVANADVIVITSDAVHGATPAPPGRPVTVTVAEYLKGSGPGTLRIFDSPTSCGVVYPPSREFLLFLSRDDNGDLRTHLCAGSIPLDDERTANPAFVAERIEEVRDVLAGQQVSPTARPDGGDGAFPATGTGPDGNASFDWALVIGAAAAGGMALLVGAAFVHRRGPKR